MSRTPTPVKKYLIAGTSTVLLSLASATGYAATFTVTDFTDGASGGLAGNGAGNAGDLRSAILAANAAGGADTISFACGAPPCTITLSGPLPPITDDLTIDGGNLGDIVIDGAGSYRVFFVDTGTVTLSKLKIQYAKATGGVGGNTGGNGGGGGGGGAGLGAGLFVNQASANVTVSNVAFANNSVVGGAGGGGGNNNWAGGGGGGMAFGGGTSTANGGGAGGGGILSAGASIGTTSGGNGGNGGGGGGGAFGGVGGTGGSAYAGNAAGAAASGPGSSTAGAGGFGGGGGGAATGIAASGGFGGGGGGNGGGAAGGAGGAGGGGGGSGGGSGPAAGGSLGAGISGGLGRRGGGGGAAAGPDIFVRLGTLTTTTSTSIGPAAAGGAAGAHATASFAGTAGGAEGSPVFNFGGTVNGSGTVGAIIGALDTSATTRLIGYSGGSLSEAGANNGSISATLTLTLSNDTFSGTNGDNFISAGKATVTNVPAGLTAVLTRTSATTATLSFTGTAASHAAANSITNLTVTFVNSAFTSNSATTVVNASKNDLAINFTDPAAPAPSPDAGPSIPQLPVTIGGVAGLSPILNVAGGSGPDLIPPIVALVSNALNSALSYQGQNTTGSMVLTGYNGANLSFYPLGFQTGVARANGIYPAGNGQFTVVSSGTSLDFIPAVVRLDQLVGLLPGISAKLNDNGSITASVNGVTYVVQPDFLVQLLPATGQPQLSFEADGALRFTDASGNSQRLVAAVQEPDTVRNILKSLDSGSGLTIQRDGTAAITLNGQNYTLVPDLTLSGIPADRQGQAWWQEGPNRYRALNLQLPGTTQGFTLR